MFSRVAILCFFTVILFLFLNDVSFESNFLKTSARFHPTKLFEVTTGQTIGVIPFGILAKPTAVDVFFLNFTRLVFAAVVLPSSTKYEDSRRRALYIASIPQKKCVLNVVAYN